MLLILKWFLKILTHLGRNASDFLAATILNLILVILGVADRQYFFTWAARCHQTLLVGSRGWCLIGVYSQGDGLKGLFAGQKIGSALLPEGIEGPLTLTTRACSRSVLAVKTFATHDIDDCVVVTSAIFGFHESDVAAS